MTKPKPTPPATEVRRFRTEYRRQEGRTMTGLVATYGRTYDIGQFTERLLPGVPAGDWDGFRRFAGDPFRDS
jgi:hypothetical protein